MIPKSGKSPADSRKSVGIHEFAALARSSLNGISQAVRDHVTKPTSLAQGRVAHLIEWKGWPKPPDPPPNAHAHFSSYCHLTEGEQEARFAAGVAEQFAIAEAKLRAWASTEEEEEEEEEEQEQEDSTDEDPLPVGKARSFAQHSDAATSGLVPGAPLQSERSAGEAAPPQCSLGSGSSSFLSAAHASLTGSSALPNTCTNAPQGEEVEEEVEEEEEEEHQGHREQPAPLLEQRGEVCVHHKPEWRTRARSSRFDSCYSTSESPGEEEEEEEEEGSVFQDGRAWRCSQRSFFSDRASSGVASFDEEEERDEAEDGEKEFLM